MTYSSRRNALKLMAGGTLAATGMATFATTASAQEFVVTNNYQNFKRGKIDGLHPDRRILNVTWEDMGRVKMRAADLVDQLLVAARRHDRRLQLLRLYRRDDRQEVAADGRPGQVAAGQGRPADRYPRRA